MRDPFPRKASASYGIGILLVAGSLIAAVVFAGFLLPFFQVILVLWAIPGTVCGLIAGWRRSRFGAVASVAVLAAIYVICNFEGPFGIRTAIERNLLGRPIPVMYFHTWSHLLHTLVIPLNFGVAIVACELMGRRRRRGDTPEPFACGTCGYNLTGNLSGRCPECGAPCAPTPE